MTLPYAEIQGILLRSAKMPLHRHLLFRIDAAAAAARRFLGGLVDGDGPRVGSAEPWTADTKPPYVLYVSLTYPGLRALELPASTLASFPEEYVEGGVRRAEKVGDVGASAPNHWKAPLNTEDVQLVVTIPAMSQTALDEATDGVRAAAARGGACTEVGQLDAAALPRGNLAHFGYADGYSQPTIEGGFGEVLVSPAPDAPAGAFILGYPSQYAGLTYQVPEPDVFGRHGGFGALRVLEQDCAGFEAFLEANRDVIDTELLVAKICRRWRNGVPLAMSPDPPTPDPPIPTDKLNWFDYKPTEATPDAVDDRKGYRCPIGSHVRRMNPRSSTVAGANGHKRRIARRGLPYGAPFDPDHPDDGIERGLLGMFICVSLKDQFEFLMEDWANAGDFAPGLRHRKDPIIGANDASSSSFKIRRPRPEPPIEITGFSRFVTTRGGAYCFFPSLPALRYSAGM